MTLWLAGSCDDRIAVARIAELGTLAPKSRTYAEPREILRELDATADVRAHVVDFCTAHGIEIDSAGFRSFVTSGTIAAYERAFGTTIVDVTHDDSERFHRRATALTAPDALAPVIRGVFGLDAWPHANHRVARAAIPDASDAALATARAARAETAEQTLRRYNIPQAWTGRGETIGILRYGGTFDTNDFTATLAAHGVDAAVPEVVTCDGASALGHDVETFEGELAIDVAMIAIHAPDARVILYTTSHGERGFLDAIEHALFDARRPATFSISFGYPEFRWTHAALARLDELAAIAALLGVTLLAASGDAGAAIDDRGKAHVCAPASNRYVLACGATVIGSDATESAWPHSGGGIAAHFEAPWQRDALDAYAAGCDEPSPTTRGVPDVAAQVDPGYRMVYRGAPSFATGTSAIAPLWAAIVARLNERLGTRAGFFAPLLYASDTTHLPVRSISTGGNARYVAGPGWSPVTGLGVPDGEKLYERLCG